MATIMIEPLLQGKDLVDSILSAQPFVGSVTIWRLGQAGIVVKFPSFTALVDPYLSNHCEAILPYPFDHRRLTRAPLDASEIDWVDLVLITHDHPDHLDPPTLRTLSRQNPTATVVAPASSHARLLELGWTQDSVLTTSENAPVHIRAAHIVGFPVAHEEFLEDPPGSDVCQGFAISDGYLTVVHIGDSIDSQQTRDSLRLQSIDVLFVPINGRSDARAALGFAGNMTAAEAAAFAVAVGAGLTVPMHYDMFQQNVDVSALETFDRVADQLGASHITLQVGEKATFQSTRRK